MYRVGRQTGRAIFMINFGNKIVSLFIPPIGTKLKNIIRITNRISDGL